MGSGSGSQGRMKLKAFLSFRIANVAQNCPFLLSCKLLENVSEKNIVAFLFGVVLSFVGYTL